MQGTPDAPRCGFSSRTVAALRRSGTPFGHFDILSDEAVRQAAKVIASSSFRSPILNPTPVNVT